MPVPVQIKAVAERPVARMRAEIAGCFLRVAVRAVRATGGAGGTSIAVVFSSGSLIISRRPHLRRVRVLLCDRRPRPRPRPRRVRGLLCDRRHVLLHRLNK